MYHICSNQSLFVNLFWRVLFFFRLLRVDDIQEEEPSNGAAISITEYNDSNIHPEILNPSSPERPSPPQAITPQSPPSSVINQTPGGHVTGQDMVQRRPAREGERQERRMKRKIKSQSLIQTDV